MSQVHGLLLQSVNKCKHVYFNYIVSIKTRIFVLLNTREQETFSSYIF